MSITLVREVRGWLRRLVGWAVGSLLVAVATGVVLLALLLCFGPLAFDLGVRCTGLALQLLGLLTTAIGIRDTRRVFGKPTFLELIRRWLREIPGFRPRVVNISGQASLSMSAEATGTVRKRAKDGTIDQRLDALEFNLRQLDNEVQRVDAEATRTSRQLHLDLQDERTNRENGDRRLHETIQSATADGLHLAAIGLIWVAVGSVLSTLPAEVVWLAKHGSSVLRGIATSLSS